MGSATRFAVCTRQFDGDDDDDDAAQNVVRSTQIVVKTEQQVLTVVKTI